MNRSFHIGVALLGLVAGVAQAEVRLSIDGQAPILTQSDIAEIVYIPSARRLEVRTQWDDLRCVLNPDGPQVTLPEPQPGDFVLALDSYDGDVLGEYVVESDGEISQLLGAIQGDPTVLGIVTSQSRVNNCNPDGCAVLVCAPGGTPVFQADFEPIAVDLTVDWDTVPAAQPTDIVAGGGARTLRLTASNDGLLDATSVFVDVDVLVPGDASVPCPTVVSGGTGFSFDANCSGTWNIGDLPAQGSLQMELAYSAASNASLGELVISDAIIDAPTVADLNPANNTASIDLEVVREAELIADTVSIPSAVLDLTGGPATLNFSMAVDPVRGPSDLNNQIVFDIQLPSSGDVQFDITNPNFDGPNRTWTPTVGGLPVELTGSMTVNSFEPGMQNFCFGITSATPVDAGVNVFLAADSDNIRCLDVAGPETIALSTDAAAPATIVAGTTGAGPGNLVQTLTLSNSNQTFDGDNIGAEIVATLPASGVTLDSAVASVGSLVQTAPGTWDWSIPVLAAGQSATVDLTYVVDASASELDVVVAGIGNLTIDPSQVLADPGANAQAATTIEREIDLVVVSGASSSTVQPGDTLTYQFQATNVGPSDGSAITLDLATVLPSNVTVNSVSSSFLGSYSNGTWTIPSLEAGVAIGATLTVVIDVGAGATPAPNAISGTVSVTGSNETRINTGNDASTRVTSIVAN